MNNFLERSFYLVEKGDEFIDRYGINEFPFFACQSLLEAQLKDLFNLQALGKIVLSSDFKVPQNYRNFEFSDLPITLARGKNCFLDLYIWRRRPTTIHNHHFIGAFQNLVGKNLDVEFEFIEQRKIGSFHALGELKVTHSKFITPGSVQMIQMLDGFIHQSHHHAELTVNLCFRTPDIGKERISNFLFSGLRYIKDTDLLGRVEWFMRLSQISDFQMRDLDLGVDEMVAILMDSYGVKKKFPILLKFETILKEEFNLDIEKLMHEHELSLDEYLYHYT